MRAHTFGTCQKRVTYTMYLPRSPPTVTGRVRLTWLVRSIHTVPPLARHAAHSASIGPSSVRRVTVAPLLDVASDAECTTGPNSLYCELPIATALVINELQPHPGPRPDAVGEYIELYNPTDSLIELDGYELETSDGGFHSIVAPGLIMVPGSFIVLGPVIDPLLMGFTAHYAYGGDLELADPTSAGGPVE